VDRYYRSLLYRQCTAKTDCEKRNYPVEKVHAPSFEYTEKILRCTVVSLTPPILQAHQCIGHKSLTGCTKYKSENHELYIQRLEILKTAVHTSQNQEVIGSSLNRSFNALTVFLRGFPHTFYTNAWITQATTACSAILSVHHTKANFSTEDVTGTYMPTDRNYNT